MRETTKDARTGTVLVTASAIAYSTAGFFTRAIEADVWTLLLWRGVYAGLAVAAFVIWRERGRTGAAFSDIGWPGVVVALASALATIAYLNALRLTSVADVLVISATAPLLTAALAWLAFREPTPRSRLLASGAALAGVVVTLGGVRTPGNQLGCLLALAMTVSLAVMMITIRRHRHVSMLPATCMSAFLCAAMVLPIAAPGTVRGSQMGLVALFGIAQFGLGLILLTIGTRMINATRAALIGILDVPLGALWVWLIFAELPATPTFVGGAIIIAAVIGDVWITWEA